MKSAMAIAVPFMSVKPRHGRAASLVAVLLIGLVLGGCERNYTFAQAKTLFDSHRAAFEYIVAAIVRCGGAEEINADPTLNTIFSQCSKQSASFSDEIVKKLAQLHIEAAVMTWGAGGRLRTITFILTSYGLGVSGSGSVIVYYATPIRRSESERIPPRPLTVVPSHWWFETSN